MLRYLVLLWQVTATQSFELDRRGEQWCRARRRFTNGVALCGATVVTLRRQERVLLQEGEIAMGGPFEDFTVPTISFKFSAKAAGQKIKRFGPKDFRFNDDNTATCPASNLMTSPGSIYTTATGLHYQTYTARAVDCNACELSRQCLKGALKPNDGRGRQVTRFEPKVKDPAHPSERMRQAIDSPKGRQLYSQRMGTVEPVFANIRHNKRLTRLNHRGRAKVNTQWNLYCMVHNIEKLAKTDLGRRKAR